MAKFCKFCGSPLEEGQVCSCQASQAAPVAVATEAAPAAPASPNLFAKLKSAFLSYLRAPSATVGKALNDGVQIPAILAGVNALAAFLFVWKLIGGFLSSIVDAISDAMSGISGMLGGNASVDLEVTYPIFVLLLGGILLAVVFIGLSALGLFGAAKLTKKELTIQQSATVAAYNSVIPSLLLLLGILLGFISTTAQLIVLPVAAIVWAIFSLRDTQEYAGLNPTASSKNLAIQTILMLVISGLCIYLAWEIGLWCAGEVEIEGEKIADSIEQMTKFFEDFDITDLMGGLM